MGSSSARLAGGMVALVLAGAAAGTATAQDGPGQLAPDPAGAGHDDAHDAVVPRPDPPPEATSTRRDASAAPVRRPAAVTLAPAASARPPAATATTGAPSHVPRAGARAGGRHDGSPRRRAARPVPATAPSFARAVAAVRADRPPPAGLAVPRELLGAAGTALLLAAAGGAAGLRRGGARLRP
jgi:hypothetical protein